jgi:hypothetical protein
MPILNNALSFAADSGSRFTNLAAATKVNVPLTSAAPAASQPAAPPRTSPILSAAALSPAMTAVINPGILTAPVFTGPLIPVPTSRSATQLVRGAIDQLNSANAGIVNEAINAIKSRNLTGEGVMDYLERKVRVGEVLNQLARDWSATTRADFAEAFQMAPDRLEVMDALTSIAILNDRDLEHEIRGENLPQVAANDLRDNRRVVWQYPREGTPLRPPYVIIIAVEYQDVAQADDIVRSFTDQLGIYQGLKVPKSVIQKL